MALTTAALKWGLGRIAAHMETVADQLNVADGKIGDGDLGVTMVRGGRHLVEALPDLPDDVGMALMRCAQAFTKSSGSSYGTLLATGLMSAAKSCGGREEVPWAEVSGLLAGALAAMRARGKAELGDKTVLDAIDDARAAAEGRDAPAALLDAAATAVDETLSRFRDQRNKVGRARIFGDKSIGLDDPGMLAFKEMIAALRCREPVTVKL